MKKEKMVTRTINSTKAQVMRVNVKTATVETVTVEVAGKYDDMMELLKAVQIAQDTEETKTVTVITKEDVETLYGMPESVFMRYAEVLPPRKVCEKETEE